jgi:hypothetical protein
LYPFNSFKQLESSEKRFKKYIDISISYIFVSINYGNTTSCGFSSNFQNSDVHNLLIDAPPDSNFLVVSVVSDDKKRGGSNLLPSNQYLRNKI